MKEGAKTLVFVVVTVALLGAAWLTRPSPIVELTDNEVGELYPKFKDPLQAKSLEIISYDEDSAALEPFKVAQVNGRWVIPSHSNYPADAATQLAAAATSMMDLEKLDIATSNPAEHELYGVVDPKSPNLSAGATGVGKRVTLQDGSSNTLVDYIIGKADEKQPGVRFVRIPGQDPVYRVMVSTDKLSTNFGDWIEKDLLKMNAFDIKQVVLNNHSVDEANLALRYDSIISVDYESKEGKWELNDLRIGPGRVEATLKPDEELNAEKLNDLKTALDDLKIVDVSRKPQGLSADLRVNEKAVKGNSMESLMEHGFFPAKLDGKLELVSNEGEVHCGMSDGVEYVLRFGEIAGEAKKEKKDEKKDDKKAEKPEAAAGVNRYIMVTTRFQKDLIPEPELADVPALPKAGSAKAGPAAPDKAEASKDAAPKPPQAKTSEQAKSAEQAKQAPAAKTDKKKATSGGKPATGSKPAAGKGTRKAKAPTADEPDGGASGCGADPAADDDADKATDDKPADAKPAKQEAPKSEAELERDRVVQENKRLQDEYETKLKDGEKRVKELNDRFADWYYIISNETYQKIHLSRDQVIKKKELPKDEAGKKAAEEQPKDPFQLQKFKELENQGLPK